MSAILELRELVAGYQNPEGGRIDVLKGISISIEAGERVAVLGPSGSGKSTLLALMGALDKPSSGSILFEGRDLATMGKEELRAYRSTSVGLVFQKHHLIPSLSLLDNVLVPTLARAGSSQAAEERARALLGRVGLGKRMSHKPSEASGGECQRAALARALINEPRLLIADEPTGALDSANAKALADLLLELNAELGLALVLATHSEELASRMTRRIRLLDGVAI